MSQRMVTQNVTSSNIFIHQRTGECIFDLLGIEERAVLHSEKRHIESSLLPQWLWVIEVACCKNRFGTGIGYLVSSFVS